MRTGNPYLAKARSDADDRLVEAEEPLATLQLRCGGELPGTIAAPALLELVRKARSHRLRMARTIQADDGQDAITAWVEVTPDPDGEGGCRIAIANWRAVPLSGDEAGMTERRKADIDRQLAEVHARLDEQQNILSVEGSAPELEPLIQRMREGAGRPWSDFVEIEGAHHRQPMHWRLLDGARVRLEGSAREWIASLRPMGTPRPGSAGFELFLVAVPPAPRKPRGASAARQAPGIARAAGGPGNAPGLRPTTARIIANAETIRTRLAGPLAEEYSNYAADIAAAGEHLLALIEDLADLEVVEADEFSTAPDLIDAADVARRAVGILSMRAQERGISLETPGEGESLPAIGEFRRVLQVLLNLVGNAIRYSPEGSTVRLMLERKGARAHITVADEGPGLDKAQQEAVFLKFERLGRSGDGGSGLGLYISRKLARAMGGELTVESAPGKGARFSLTLPTAD